ncbi:ComEA family DNA-binding protein [Pseudoalteromonas fenneropenaei]|uniref:ComEA family DNA-binding protein n=1 Tax=Pseudoalteromonas fenneropenaei TaxID=1737459 RepID=A0ABV7CIL5_9GAMM
MKPIQTIIVAAFFALGSQAAVANKPTTENTAINSGSVSEKIATQLININTASVEDLASLPGIGKRKAEAIIAYREQQGEFKSVEELTQVKGIGEKLVAKLKDRIAL